MGELYEYIEINQKKTIKFFSFKAKDTERIIPMHWHDSPELIYCVEGKLKVWYEGKIVTLGKGDLLLINSNTPHSTQSITHNNVCIIQFPGNFLEEENKSIHLSTCENKYDAQVIDYTRKIITEIIEYHVSTNEYDYLLEQSKILHLKYLLVTNFSSGANGKCEDNNRKQLKLKQLEIVIRHLKNNYKDNPSLKEIANACGYSEAYLSRLFHTITGQTFIDFKRNLCLEKAIELMNTTDKTITQIAYESGFSNVKSFRNYFRSTMNINPKFYKRSKNDP